MSINHCIRLTFIITFFMVFSFSVQAAKPLRFELVVTDFYNPFLTAAENEKIIQQFATDSVNIIGIYKAKSGRHYQPSCMVGVTCFPFGGEWVNDYEYQKQASNVIAYDMSLRKVIFEVSDSIKFNKLNLKLEAIEITLPITEQGKNYTIRIPYQKGQNIYNIKESKSVEWSLEKPITTAGNSQTLTSHAGIAIQINSANTKLEPSTLFTQQEKNALFGHNHLLDYGGYVRLNVPDALPQWQNMGRSDGYGQAEGLWLHDKQNRMEAISLKGSVYFAPNDSFRKYEIWLKTNKQLSHIYSNPIHFKEHECGIIYGAVFYPDGTEQRYYIPKLSSSEKYNEFAIEAKKQLVNPNDLSLLTEFERSKELYYTALGERSRRDYQAKLAACKRIINDARHILSSSRSDLENEYVQYQKLIQDTTPKNIKAIGGGYGANDQEVFLGTYAVKGIDVKSFQVLNKPCSLVDRPTIKCSQYVSEYDLYESLALAKDKQHIYKGGQIFKNNLYRRTPDNASTEVDVKSFQLFYIHNRSYYYIDKYRIYKLSAGAIDASFDTQGTVYGPIGNEYKFVFLDDNGFFRVDGNRVGLCTEYFNGLESHLRGTKGQIIPLTQTPKGITWAVEDDNFEYYLVDLNNKNISYMIDKKTKLQYPLFMGDGNCRKPMNQ